MTDNIKDLLYTNNQLHHNKIVYSVSEISNVLKRTVEENYSYIRVKGEISGLKIPASGHIYFSLKDENSVLNAICWKGAANRLSVKPEDGKAVICTGSLTTYPGQSKYQIIVDSIEIEGLGALMEIFLKRKEQLEKEGLFAANKKKSLPKFPKVIGIVTSPTGAVIRDILHRLNDRFPVHVLLWPVLVQGDQAAKQVANAITEFNNLDASKNIPKPDVIIVARGGGSIEDLWAFNEEIVVRAAALSRIPLISAVGHETDTTLIDYAADVRAPTPTAAAELAVPVRHDLLRDLYDKAKRMYNDVSHIIRNNEQKLQSLARGLPNLPALILNKEQKFDDLTERLTNALPRLIDNKSNLLNSCSARLQTPEHLMKRSEDRLNYLSNMLNIAYNNLIKRDSHKYALVSANLKASTLQQYINYKNEQLTNLTSLLLTYNYQHVLKRGFAIVRDKEQNILRSIAALKPGNKISIELADGIKEVIVDQ